MSKLSGRVMTEGMKLKARWQRNGLPDEKGWALHVRTANFTVLEWTLWLSDKTTAEPLLGDARPTASLYQKSKLWVQRPA
jgi:hypothetical protein